jgi:hypothetical protein
MERRTKRSGDRATALQYLVETVADRSGVRALVLCDDAGTILAGMGPANDVSGLARAALDVAWKRATPNSVAAITAKGDVTARGLATPDGMLYFGALGDRVTGVGDAVRAVHRILYETAHA